MCVSRWAWTFSNFLANCVCVCMCVTSRVIQIFTGLWRDHYQRVLPKHWIWRDQIVELALRPEDYLKLGLFDLCVQPLLDSAWSTFLLSFLQEYLRSKHPKENRIG